MKSLPLAAGILALTLVLNGSVQAQTPAPAARPATPATETSSPSKVAKVETWTKKQWASAQKTWAKDKAKWKGCRDQSAGRHLSGRKSWSFLYDCMTGPV